MTGRGGRECILAHDRGTDPFHPRLKCAPSGTFGPLRRPSNSWPVWSPARDAMSRGNRTEAAGRCSRVSSVMDGDRTVHLVGPAARGGRTGRGSSGRGRGGARVPRDARQSIPLKDNPAATTVIQPRDLARMPRGVAAEEALAQRARRAHRQPGGRRARPHLDPRPGRADRERHPRHQGADGRPAPERPDRRRARPVRRGLVHGGPRRGAARARRARSTAAAARAA